MSVLMQAIRPSSKGGLLDQPKSKRKESPRRVGGALHSKRNCPLEWVCWVGCSSRCCIDYKQLLRCRLGRKPEPRGGTSRERERHTSEEKKIGCVEEHTAIIYYRKMQYVHRGCRDEVLVASRQ